MASVTDSAKKMLIAAILWGITFTLFSLFFYGGLTRSLIIGVVFGIVMGPTQVFGPKLGQYLAGSKEGGGKVNHTMEMEVEGDIEEIFKIILDASGEILGKIKNMNIDKTNKIIEFNSIRTLDYPGNKITAKLQRIDNYRTKIHINSQPIRRTVSLDRGFNFQNIKVFRAKIKNSVEIFSEILTSV